MKIKDQKQNNDTIAKEMTPRKKNKPKHLILAFLVSFLVTAPLHAKIYQIPAPLFKEGQKLYQQHKKYPHANEIKFNLAINYAYTGQIEKGWSLLKEVPESYAPIVIEEYSKKIKENPKEWKNYFKRAFGYYFLKQKQNTKNDFLSVLKIDPQHIWAMGFLGLVEGEMKNNDKAITWCKKALKIEKNATAIHFLLAEAYRRKGNYIGFTTEMMIVGRLKTEELKKRKKYE